MNWIRSIPAAGLLLAAAPAWGQCVMCQTAASAQQAQAAKAMNFAILILLLPAVTLFCGVIVFAFRCRNEAKSLEDPEHCAIDFGEVGAETEERQPCESAR